MTLQIDFFPKPQS